MIEVMKQALEAWETSVYGSERHHKAMLLAMTNMGQAIEQAEKQVPVAWMDGYRNIYSLEEKAAGCEDAVIPLVPAIQHWSDCAVHNEPAYPKGDCDCGGYTTPQLQQAAKQEPVALEIIRKWPEGFQERLQHVWLDVVSFIPNVKLYDLQRVLAEFGFTMKLYEGEAPTAQQQEIDWKDQYEKQKRRSDMWQAKYEKDIGPIEKAGPVTARREWVGITTEEMEKSKPPLSNDAIVWELAVEWAEAKLKEKNT